MWIIVDDGSTDDTRNIVEGWIKESNSFEIKYIYKEMEVYIPVIIPQLLMLQQN